MSVRPMVASRQNSAMPATQAISVHGREGSRHGSAVPYVDATENMVCERRSNTMALKDATKPPSKTCNYRRERSESARPSPRDTSVAPVYNPDGTQKTGNNKRKVKEAVTVVASSSGSGTSPALPVRSMSEFPEKGTPVAGNRNDEAVRTPTRMQSSTIRARSLLSSSGPGRGEGQPGAYETGRDEFPMASPAAPPSSYRDSPDRVSSPAPRSSSVDSPGRNHPPASHIPRNNSSIVRMDLDSSQVVAPSDGNKAETRQVSDETMTGALRGRTPPHPFTINEFMEAMKVPIPDTSNYDPARDLNLSDNIPGTQYYNPWDQSSAPTSSRPALMDPADVQIEDFPYIRRHPTVIQSPFFPTIPGIYPNRPISVYSDTSSQPDTSRYQDTSYANMNNVSSFSIFQTFAHFY